MQLLYDLLQIPPCSKWNIFKRVKTYFKVRNTKKIISKEIYNWNSFFENVIDFCIFMEHAKRNFQIPSPDNYDCKIIEYNATLTTYILKFKALYSGKESEVNIIYKTDESDRVNVKMVVNLRYSELGYDIYLESDKLDSYKKDDLKKEIIEITLDYMNHEILKTLDSIANKYIFIRKDKSNENEKKEI